MSIPNAALQKLLQEVETQSLQSQQQITQTQSHLASKRRDLRLTQLTAAEVSQLPRAARVYEGVGKMFVAAQDAGAVTARLGRESDKLEREIKELETRLQYQETTYKNSRDTVRRILEGGTGGGGGGGGRD